MFELGLGACSLRTGRTHLGQKKDDLCEGSENRVYLRQISRIQNFGKELQKMLLAAEASLVRHRM